jgi:type VI secretion system protein ImpK
MVEKLLLFETYLAIIKDATQLLLQDKALTAIALRNSIEEKLNQAKEVCTDYAIDQVQQAEFAVCAYLDSYVLTNNWSCVNDWRKNLLQDEYFKTTDAGVLFYERCETLDAQQIDLIHLYFSCLAAGFRGQYYAQSMNPSIRQVMENLLLKCDSLAKKMNPGLFIESPTTSLRLKKHTTFKMYICIATPLLLFMAAYGYFYLIISHGVQSYLASAT